MAKAGLATRYCCSAYAVAPYPTRGYLDQINLHLLYLAAVANLFLSFSKQVGVYFVDSDYTRSRRGKFIKIKKIPKIDTNILQ